MPTQKTWLVDRVPRVALPSTFFAGGAFGEAALPLHDEVCIKLGKKMAIRLQCAESREQVCEIIIEREIFTFCCLRDGLLFCTRRHWL